MSENIKEAIAYGVELASREEKIITVDDKHYYDDSKANLVELEPKLYPDVLELCTLDSLVDYLKSGLNNTSYQRLMVIVESPTQVSVYTEDDEKAVRTRLVSVEARIPSIQYGYYMLSTDFNVYLQSKFEDTDDRDVVLNFASALKIDNGSEIVDNGVSQTTTVKTGVANLAKAKAPNPVMLRPYRTFAEVEQPASQFVFRIDKNAEMALFSADGGKWRLDAINNVAKYLKAQLAEQNNITILA